MARSRLLRQEARLRFLTFIRLVRGTTRGQGDPQRCLVTKPTPIAAHFRWFRGSQSPGGEIQAVILASSGSRSPDGGVDMEHQQTSTIGALTDAQILGNLDLYEATRVRGPVQAAFPTLPDPSTRSSRPTRTSASCGRRAISISTIGIDHVDRSLRFQSQWNVCRRMAATARRRTIPPRSDACGRRHSTLAPLRHAVLNYGRGRDARAGLFVRLYRGQSRPPNNERRVAYDI